MNALKLNYEKRKQLVNDILANAAIYLKKKNFNLNEIIDDKNYDINVSISDIIIQNDSRVSFYLNISYDNEILKPGRYKSLLQFKDMLSLIHIWYKCYEKSRAVFLDEMVTCRFHNIEYEYIGDNFIDSSTFDNKNPIL